MILFYASMMLGMALAPQPVTPVDDKADVATCVVDNDMRDVRTLLQTPPGSDEERRVGSKVMVYYGGCDDNRVANGQIGWRERAEIAYAALLNRLDERRFDASAPLPPRANWALMTKAGYGADQKLVAIREFGDCVVGLAPADALRLVRSSPGSADEAAVIAALRPSLNDCLAPKQNFTVKRADLRLIVAEPLYHMTSK